MTNRLKSALAWILDLILTIIGTALLGRVFELLANPSIGGIVGVSAIIGATALTVYLLLEWRKESISLDPRFMHLEILYSHRDDTPDTERHSRPYYVMNKNTKQAYPVPDLIMAYVHHHKISWHSYDNEKALRTYFRSQGIHVNEENPSDRELGLLLTPNGALIQIVLLKPELSEKLMRLRLEGKLKHFKIIYLYPWYVWFLRVFPYIKKQASPSNKRVIVNFSTKEAFGAPAENFDLVGNRIIESESLTPRPWESVSKWCKRKGWTLNERPFTVEELAGIYQ